MGNILEFVKGLAVVAALAWAGWYAYSQWDPAPTVEANSRQAGTFNCRKALADLARGYDCLNSDNCADAQVERAEIKKLEADIGQFCN